MSLVRIVAGGSALSAAAGALVHEGFILTAHGVAAVRRLDAPSVTTAEHLLLGAAGAGLAAAGLWLGAVWLICLHDILRGASPRPATLWRPARVRSVLIRTCAPTLGAALVCAAPAVASADTGAASRHPSSTVLLTERLIERLTGLPLPQRPLTVHLPAAQGPATETPPADLRVRRGESLWSMTAELLGSDATVAQVDRGWRAVYRINRDRVGPDPDLLLPGTRLVVPPSLSRVPAPTR